MTVPFYPSALVGVGIVKEASYGAGGTPAALIPVTSISPPDVVGLLSDAGWRGAPADAYQDTAGPLASQLTLGGPIYADTIGYPLAGILGDVAFAGGSPNTWTIASINSGAQQPPSYELTVADPIGQLQYGGCKWSNVQLNFDPSGLLTWTGRVDGLAGTASAATMPTASAELPLPGWAGIVTLAGSTETRLLSAAISFDRAAIAKRNVTGQQAPYLQRSDVLAVTGRLALAVVADTYRQDYVAGTAIALDLNFSRGAGAGLRQLVVHCSKTYLTGAPRGYGNKWIDLEATFKADHNTSDVGASGGYSPAKVTLKNTVASGSYA